MSVNLATRRYTLLNTKRPTKVLKKEVETKIIKLILHRNTSIETEVGQNSNEKINHLMKVV